MLSLAVCRLKTVVVVTHEIVFRRALVEELHGNAEAIQVTLKSGAQPVSSRPRMCLPQKSKWLADHMGILEAAGMVYGSKQAVYGSVAMAFLKGVDSFKLLLDYRTVHAQI